MLCFRLVKPFALEWAIFNIWVCLHFCSQQDNRWFDFSGQFLIRSEIKSIWVMPFSTSIDQTMPLIGCKNDEQITTVCKIGFQEHSAVQSSHTDPDSTAASNRNECNQNASAPIVHPTHTVNNRIDSQSMLNWHQTKCPFKIRNSNLSLFQIFYSRAKDHLNAEIALNDSATYTILKATSLTFTRFVFFFFWVWTSDSEVQSLKFMLHFSKQHLLIFANHWPSRRRSSFANNVTRASEENALF